MKNTKSILSVGMLLSLTFVAPTFAHAEAAKMLVASPQLAKPTCNLKHPSDVCIVNRTGETAYVSIEKFGVTDSEVESNPEVMVDFYSQDKINPIGVKIFNSQKELIFEQAVKNHGPIVLVPEGKNSKKPQ